jgi:hypothetical protein
VVPWATKLSYSVFDVPRFERKYIFILQILVSERFLRGLKSVCSFEIPDDKLDKIGLSRIESLVALKQGD